MAGRWNNGRRLRLALEAAGAQVLLMDPVPGLPDLVFTANAAIIYRDTAVLARFRYPQRQGEEPLDEAWLLAAGLQVPQARSGRLL